jgi:hypothetical protein
MLLPMLLRHAVRPKKYWVRNCVTVYVYIPFWKINRYFQLVSGSLGWNSRVILSKPEVSFFLKIINFIWTLVFLKEFFRCCSIGNREIFSLKSVAHWRRLWTQKSWIQVPNKSKKKNKISKFYQTSWNQKRMNFAHNFQLPKLRVWQKLPKLKPKTE